MAYNPTFTVLSFLKPLFFNGLKNESPFLDNAGSRTSGLRIMFRDRSRAGCVV
jgi:hypothetical protein